MKELLTNILLHDIYETFFIILFWIIIILLINQFLNHFIHKHSKNNTKIYIRSKNTIIWIVFLFIIAAQFKATNRIVTTLLASSGVIAVFVGIACQQVASDIFAGALILLTHPYKIGDYITIESQNITNGLVTDISIRYTFIKTLTNTTLIIPNTTMNSCVIENSSQVEAVKANYINIGISYNDDINKAMDIIRQCILGKDYMQPVFNHPFFIDKSDIQKVPIIVQDFKDSCIPLKIIVYSLDWSSGPGLCSNLRVDIKQVLDEQHITIPFNTITIINQNSSQS